MKIHVDRARCSGHAMCFGRAPELYELDAVGYSALTDVDVPEGLEEAARVGALACPEQAITIEE